MDLPRHLAVLWRFRPVVLGGISLGLILAVFASYSVSWSGGPSFTPRGEEVWSANSSILVTQPGFPEGRVTLPEKQVEGAVSSSGRTASPNDQVEFADPARLAGLADLYSRFLLTDEVLSRVPGGLDSDSVQASPFASSQGGLVLPVIQLTTIAADAAAARALNEKVFGALRTVLTERQAANKIAPGRRVELKLIDAPEAVLTSPRSRTLAILVFALCTLGGVALAHLLAALRSGAAIASSKDAVGDEPPATLIPWTFESDENAPERVSRSGQPAGEREPALPPVARDGG